jgi:2-C-methyl-D-erythritol 2,4-cyclodiphosphate synthase
LPVGIGYDVHRFAAGRRLILGGIEFGGDRGLLGHSDADVVTHAVMDALLGAAGLGDIGRLFPPGDPQFADADSVGLLREVTRLLGSERWEITNIDVTIIAEQPKVSPHVGAMRERLAEAAGIRPEQVNLKATTNEGLGFIGRGEGIAALAVAELYRSAP